jgi:ankyrin repeat protein
VARTITEKLPKKPGAYALQTQSSVPDHFIQILCWAVYQSSNNLLSDDQTDNFLQWIIKHGNIQFLQQFTQISDSVTRVLMANLLFSAIRLNSKETVQFLLENGTKPSIIHRISRETVLQLAIKDELSNAEIVRLLLEHGACPNATCVGSTDERSPLCLAMMDLPRKSSIAEMLVLAGADVDVSYSDTKYPGIHKTPLIVAAAQEDAFLTGLLLEKGANPNDFYPGSRSALHAAVRSNRPGSVEALLKAGADANIPYGEGKRPNFNHVFKHFSQDSPYDALYSLLTPIDIAYKNGNSKIVDLLLQANAHADGCLAFVANWDRSAGCMALQDAARRGKRHLVESLLMAGVDVNAPPCHDGGRTALQAAAESGNIDMVQLLLDRGAFVNTPPCSSGGLTALQAAIYSRDLDLIELLMREGGRINAEAARYGGSTCFEAAVSTGDIDLVNTLLALGADINPTCYYPGKSIVFQIPLVIRARPTTNVNQDGREISALTWSISQHNRQLFDLLMSKGARPDLPQDCPTPLFAAIEVGSFDMAVRLIEAGADVNRPSRVGDARLDSYSLQTPLQTAIKQGDKKLINLLIESHADINYSHDGTQFGAALKSAISCKNREAVQLLLSRGAHPGRTASLASVIPDAGSHVDLEIFRMLISHNAEVNPLPWDSPFFQAFTKLQYPALAMAPQGLRLTPFQTALERGHEELASMLLEAGADFNAPAFWRGGKTALQAAAMSGSFSFVESLVSRGADINAPPAREHGATALQFAAIQGHYNIVVLLLENGADINAPRAAVGGRTALEGAAEHGRLDIVHLLLENDKQEESLGQRCQGAAVFAETYGHFVIAETLRGWKKT